MVQPRYLLKTLPQKYEFLLNEVKEYRDYKGKIFEKMVFDLIDKIPNTKFHKNVKYGQYELDALLNFSKSSWFVECSSHHPSRSSLSGNQVSAQNDLDKAVRKCKKQAIRAIEHAKHPNIQKHHPRNIKGVLVVLEGLYPNQNWELILPERKNDCTYKTVIINFFDLQVLLKQPEQDFFEEFLLWRTQKNMPIYCFNEKDYWAWYFNMKSDCRMQEAFKQSQERNITVLYISQRFNNKSYLDDIAKN